MRPPMRPRKEPEASSTMVKPGPKLWRNQRTTLMARMRVPAFTRKPRTFSHTCMAQFWKVGRR